MGYYKQKMIERELDISADEFIQNLIDNPDRNPVGDFDNRVMKKKAIRTDWNPSNVYVFDIETWGLDATKFAVGGFKSLQDYIEGKSMRVFHDKLEMKNAILSCPDKSIFYAHNAEYDIAGLWTIEEFREMPKIYPTRLIMASTAPPNLEKKSVDWNAGIQLRDSWSIFSYPLAQLGEDLGFSKGQTPEKFIKGIPTKIDEKDLFYLERDLDILAEGISQMQSLFAEWVGKENANLPLTAAGISWSIFTEKFWPEKWAGNRQRYKNGLPATFCPKKCRVGRAYIFTSNNCPVCGEKTEMLKTKKVAKLFINREYNDAGIEAYYGGRTQVICEPKAIHESVICFDANSLYPSMMINNSFPSPVNHWIEPPSLWKLSQLIKRDDRLVIANLMLNGDNSTARFLPSTNEEGRRDYTKSTFDGWLCEPEIKAAIERGWVVEKVHDLVSYGNEKPFKEFVEFFYNLRLEYREKGDNRQSLIKLILNSLYGKFGQKDMRNRIENSDLIHEITENEEWWFQYEMKDWNHFNGVYLTEIEPSKMSDNSFSPIAAFVTSYGRVFLQEAIEATDAIYVDTDSVFSLKSFDEIDELLPLGDELSQWKQEGKISPFIQFWEPKVYRKFNENMGIITVKHKGANRSDGDLEKPQFAEMMNKYRHTINTPKSNWGEFRIVEKKSKRFHKEK